MSYNVNTDLIKGNSIMLYIANTPIAFSKSCDLSVNVDTIDTTNKMSGMWKANLSGQMSYTVTCDALYTRATGDTSFDTLFTAMVTGENVDIEIGIATPSTFALGTGLYSGTATITSLNLKAEDNGIASCSITLTGSGELVKAVVLP